MTKPIKTRANRKNPVICQLRSDCDIVKSSETILDGCQRVNLRRTGEASTRARQTTDVDSLPHREQPS